MHFKARFEKLNKGQTTTSINLKLTTENAYKAFEILKESIKIFYELTNIPVPGAVYAWKIIKEIKK